ncbi:MAG: PHB depolymerase family esterase [Acidimicrobiales bacterium]
MERVPTLVGALLLAATAACAGGTPRSSPPTRPAAVQRRQLTFGGQPRSYRVYAPATLEGSQFPLVLALHGEGNTADSLVETTQFDRQAQTGNFIVAYPEGLGLSWNAGLCCGRSMYEGVDDVGFLNRVVDEIERDHPIDRTRVYVVGISSGAFMAYRFACESAGRLAGVGSVAGAMTLDACNPARPLSVIEIHGTADPLVPFSGGPVQPPGVASADAPATAAMADRWATLDGCPGPPRTTTTAVVTTTTWEACRAATSVRLVSVDGGGHTWFAPGLGPVAGAVDATADIWAFLSGRPR